MKREEILKKFIELLPELENYDEILKKKNKNLIRFVKFKEKFLIKGLTILLKIFFNLNIKKRTKIFYGREIEVYLGDANATVLYFTGCLCGDESFLTFFLLKNLKSDDIFYDIGANYGFYTLLAQEIITKGEIHSFEPHPKIFELLKRNAKLDIYQNTFLNQKALSDKNGEVEFYDHFDKNRHSGGSSLLDDLKQSKKIIVNSITLDEYIKNHKPPTIMKIDIQYAEYLMLKGAKKTLSEFKPKIIMEILPHEYHRKALQILLDLGYKMYSFNREGQINVIENKTIQAFLEGKENLEGNFYFENE